MDRKLATLLAQATKAHETHPDLREFVGMATDLTLGNYTCRSHPSEAAMLAESWVGGGPLDSLRDACTDAADLAQWRLTYEGSKIDPDFMERFGCYCMIGDGGFWNSRQMSGYVVYMPAGLHYPWHEHPAEEMYVILAGQAEFQLKGQPAHTARAGDAVFHPGGQPHATTTYDSPMMAYVTWRNHLDITPVWTDPNLRGE